MCLCCQTMTGWHARGKRISLYAHDISNLLHSASWFKMGTGKRRSIHFRLDLHKVFPPVFFSGSLTIQLLQLSVAMRPENDSCMDKLKEMYPRLKLYHVKVEN